MHSFSFWAIMIIFVYRKIEKICYIIINTPAESQLILYVRSVLELATFVGHFCYLCFVFVMLSCFFVLALWPPTGKGLMFYCGFVTFPCGVLGQVWYMIVSISDLCLLTYFGRRLYPTAENEDWVGLNISTSMLSYVLMQIFYSPI